MLITRPGEIVTRDSIRQSLWAEGTFVDFESAVNACVSQIRTALGDKATTPRYIETLPRRGYRFVAPVESTASPSSAHRSPHRPPLRLWILTALALILASTSIYVTGRIGRPAKMPRVGVLPIDSSAGEMRLRSLGSVLQEQTLVELVAKGRTVVVAKPAVEHLRGDRRTVDELAKLNLDFAIDASVEPLSDGVVRLHTKIVRMTDLRILSAQDYDRRDDVLLSRRHDIAIELAERLLTAIARSHRSESAASLAARDRALSGEAALENGNEALALTRLEEAVAADPANAWSRALLARALVRASFAGDGPLHQTLERARQEATDVLEADASSSDAWAALGIVQFWRDGNAADANESLQRATSLDGASVDARLWLALLHHVGDRPADADHVLATLDRERPVSFATHQTRPTIGRLAVALRQPVPNTPH